MAADNLEHEVAIYSFTIIFLLLSLRMTQDLRLHSCRLCGAPLLRAFKHLQDHLLALHGLGVRAYRHLQGERALEETGEEARVNGLGRDALLCPEAGCGRRQRGFSHLYRHLQGEHKVTTNFARALARVSGQLGLERCGECNLSGAVMVRGFGRVHDSYYHGRKKAIVEEGFGSVAEEEAAGTVDPSANDGKDVLKVSPDPDGRQEISLPSDEEAVEKKEAEDIRIKDEDFYEEEDSFACRDCRICGESVEASDFESHLWN